MDLATFAAIASMLVALASAVFALVQADAAKGQVRAAKEQVDAAKAQVDAAREQAEAARQQAEEAKRSNDLVERAQREQGDREQREHGARAVLWEVVDVAPNGCRLRNEGHSTAHRVVVKTHGHEDDWQTEAHGDYKGVDISPGESIPVRFGNRLGSKTVHTLYVLWDGASSPIPVPVPR